MNKWKEGRTLWKREFEFHCDWIYFPFYFETLTWNLDKYNGHVSILNFAIYWNSYGESIHEQE